MPDDYVPTWNGDPASFESFVTACEWYSTGLKDAERKLAASRIWQRLTGAAKSVVKHLNPSDFDSPAGLNKLLAILRDSPLQKLPVPDSFSRLERWTGLRRNQAETIPQLLVREEELFVELQNALKRARADRIKMTTTGVGTGERERDPSVSPSRSPQFTAAQREAREEAEAAGNTTAEDGGSPVAEGGFFEDELRGYRLLKAAKLSASERQHILTLTKNSTHFVAVRRALRTLFAEETTEDSRAPHGRRVWWTDAADGWPTYHVEDEAGPMVIGARVDGGLKKLDPKSTGEMIGLRLGMMVPMLGWRNGPWNPRWRRRMTPQIWGQHLKEKDITKPSLWHRRRKRHLPKRDKP